MRAVVVVVVAVAVVVVVVVIVVVVVEGFNVSSAQNRLYRDKVD